MVKVLDYFKILATNIQRGNFCFTSPTSSTLLHRQIFRNLIDTNGTPDHSPTSSTLSPCRIFRNSNDTNGIPDHSPNSSTLSPDTPESALASCIYHIAKACLGDVQLSFKAMTKRAGGGGGGADAEDMKLRSRATQAAALLVSMLDLAKSVKNTDVLTELHSGFAVNKNAMIEVSLTATTSISFLITYVFFK